jgi:hypothetical protein
VAVPNDRLGVHYFRTNITDFDVGGNVLLPVIDNANAIISDVQGQVTNSSALTAMGGGIQSAVDRLADPLRPLGVVLFTDGMQNVNPMVIETDTSPPPNAFDLHIDDQAGKPSSNISATSPPTQLNSALGISVNTIGVGAMPSFQDLLDKISQKTVGVTKITTAPDDDLRRFFVEELIDVLRGFSPQLVDYRQGTLATGHTTESFQVNGGGKKIVLKLSWQRGDQMQFRIEHDGQDLTAFGKIIKGDFYRIYSLDLPARVRGRSVTSDGTWTMHIEGGERGRYDAACILDEPALKYSCQVTAKPLHAGAPLFLRANLSVEGRPLDGRVKAIVSHPPTSIAALLAQIETPQNLNSIKPEPGASRAQAKLQQLLLNPVFYEQLKPVVSTVPLERQRDGSFLAKFDRTKVAGSYTIEFQMEGKHPKLGSFQRAETCTRFIPIAPPDAGGSELFAISVKKVIDGQAFLLHIAPRDKLGNMLGPDAANKIRVAMRPGDVGSDCVQDLGDGSYLVPLFVPASGDSQIEVGVGGHVVFAGKLSSIVR